MSYIYFDNAATTPMHPFVIDEMINQMRQVYGNPSSTHTIGRKSRTLIESARKSIAAHFGVTASEIIFTSSGTEADNLILFNAVKNLGVERIITSKIEHHAVLHTVDALKKDFSIQVESVKLTDRGEVDLEYLEYLISKSSKKTLVSLMFINNEIGNKLPLQKVVDIAHNHNALIHSDTVQAIGHYPIDLSEISLDFMVGSAHKFHGPKGVGFAFFRKGFGIEPMIHGGNQEKGARSSTESVHAILAMNKALELSLENVARDIQYLNELKKYCIESLEKLDQRISFNGTSDNLEESSCTILSVCLPKEYPMILFQLDLAGIAVSGGSACQSGSQQGSHVLKEINGENDARTSIRISFSTENTKEHIDYFIESLKNLL